VDRLKSENKQLHEKMIERERTMASMDFTSRHGTKEDGANKLDIDMLVKLTTRLQKASHTYESLRGDMDKIKEVLTYMCNCAIYSTKKNQTTQHKTQAT